MAFVDKFTFDLAGALSKQLVASMSALSTGALTDMNIDTVDITQGIYALFHKGSLVYVGKATNLRERLTDHHEKIGGRSGISLADMAFKCLYVETTWTPMTHEDILIKAYRAAGAGCDWNGLGFGPHDPGRNREETDKRPDGFDMQYPIVDTVACTWLSPGSYTGLSLLRDLKSNLPFLLRYQAARDYRTGHPDYNTVTVVVPAPNMPAKDVLKLIAQAVPGWQATVFPSHMIFYKEAKQYTYGTSL